MQRILVHDFSGHPFQVQLSRELALRGHEVLHVYCSSYNTGRGQLEATADDSPTFAVQALGLDREFAKYSVLTRIRQEAQYAKRFTELASSFGPDVVIESNDPLLAKRLIAGRLRRAGIPWIFWLQDLYSVAIAGVLARRLGAVGRVAARLPLAVEGALLRQAAGVVPITADFDTDLDRWGVAASRRCLVPNWAPVDEIVPRSSRRWALDHGIDAKRVVLYAGTLGIKHDPSLLVRLARDLSEQDAAVVVVSEGAGADYLRAEAVAQDNLFVLPFQPWDQLTNVLASADLVLTILNGEAGVFSVPSKLFTYLCAGRPIVAAVPEVNSAARVLRASGGGVVVAPDDPDALVAAVSGLLADDWKRHEMGERARQFAEATFDIQSITDSFETVIGRSLVSAA